MMSLELQNSMPMDCPCWTKSIADKFPPQSNSILTSFESMTTLHEPTHTSPSRRAQLPNSPSPGGWFSMQDFGAIIVWFASWQSSFVGFGSSTSRCLLPKSSATYAISRVARALRTRVDETCPRSPELTATLAPFWEPCRRVLSITELTMHEDKPYSSHNLTRSFASPEALYPNL